LQESHGPKLKSRLKKEKANQAGGMAADPA